MIYDCFTFFNELDMLEVRLRTLEDIVDYFVISESPETFSGQSKYLFYGANRKRFARWNIIHVISIQEGPRWDREFGQRNALYRGFESAKPEDIIMISDVDEIPRPDVLKRTIADLSVPVSMDMKTYYWNLHTVSRQYLLGPCLMHKRDALMPQDLRNARHVIPHVKNASWHFSFFPNLDETPVQSFTQKVTSFAHGEFDTDFYRDPDRIQRVASQGRDPFERNEFPTVRDDSQDWPGFLKEPQYEAWQ